MTAALVVLGAGEATASHTCVPSDPDSDSDGLSDSCDPWPPYADADLDGYKDSLELFVTTDALNFCSFPPDINNDGRVSLQDAMLFIPAFNSRIDDPDYRPRFDLDADEIVGLGDVLQLIRYMNVFCGSYMYYPYPTIVQLHREARHSAKASRWYTDHAQIYSAEPGYDVLYCGEFENAAYHWRNNTDFDFSVSYGWQGECDQPGNVAFHVDWWDPGVAASVALWGEGHWCSDSDPCTYASFARLYMNALHPNNNSRAYRHMVFTHELGHVVTLGDIDRCDSPAWSIMFDDPYCLWDAGLHWPRGNDILFTNIKY